MTSKVPCGKEEGGKICEAGQLCWDCCKILDDRAKDDREEYEKDMDVQFKIVVKSNKPLPLLQDLKEILEEKVQEILDGGFYLNWHEEGYEASVSIEE